ncbi:MAG TPA: aspartyl/asparaginyl beta-hydroxylase domain-containing protein [Thermoanaerobaculia bacterium]
MNPVRRALTWIRRNVGLYNASRFANPFLDLFTGGKRRPVFFDIDKTMPHLRAIDAAYEDIRAELERLLPYQDHMPRYHDLDTDLLYSSARFHRDKRWNVFMLFCLDALPEENRKLCPKTCAVLDRIPHVNQAFFSILDPGKSIPAHTGPTRSYLRYHLGLRVPKQNPPQIRVRDQYYTWKEGESVLFDDSWEHEIYNQADEVRAVLIVDVMRPFIAPIFALTLLFRKIGERFYGPRIVARANTFRLPPR